MRDGASGCVTQSRAIRCGPRPARRAPGRVAASALSRLLGRPDSHARGSVRGTIRSVSRLSAGGFAGLCEQHTERGGFNNLFLFPFPPPPPPPVPPPPSPREQGSFFCV